jgi:hypothetical protein
MARDRDGHCDLCGRRRTLTFHHLVPRQLHRNKWFRKRFTREQMNAGIDICPDCHRAVHQYIDRKELGRTYNTRERLLDHPQLGRFIAWIRGRDTSRIRTRAPAG